MRLGIHYASFSHPGGPEAIAPRLAQTARVADQGGAAMFTVMDHWFQMENLGGPAEPMLEGYTTLGYLAGVTERLRLSLLVTGTTYRHPGLLAKIVTTLDVLSGGRAMLGIGAAWYDREHRGLGVPFPAMSERFERLEETLRICRQMWSDDDGAFEGEHYRLAETVCVPAPLQQPRPPIMIGGSGERKTLRLVARYADACNLFGEGPEVVAHKLEVLERHCADVGRDVAEIEKTMIFASDPLADVDGFLRQMTEYAAVGIGLVTMMPAGDDPVAWTTRVCEEVLPRLGEI
ncbi:MAG: luciferase family protein [Nocardioides sp.]|jgi:F420-dependent oxidoreductase-like protein|nr:luciferase family protein [Nocardioides sp.]